VSKAREGEVSNATSKIICIWLVRFSPVDHRYRGLGVRQCLAPRNKTEHSNDSPDLCRRGSARDHGARRRLPSGHGRQAGDHPEWLAGDAPGREPVEQLESDRFDGELDSRWQKSLYRADE
jgi:hypothetical protein